MVYSKLQQLISDNWHPEKGSWVHVAAFLAGLFFMGAATFKIYNYFILGDQSLAGHFQYWLDSGWPPEWYAHVMRFFQPYEKPVAAMVILMQIIPGFMIMTNTKTRIAGLILFTVQIQVFLGVFKHTNFNEFVGCSVWICLFYIFKPQNRADMSRQAWKILIFLFFLLNCILVYNRHNYQDHLLLSYTYQREQLAADIMGSSVYWKHFVLWITQWSWMPYFFVSLWYIRLTLTALLLTRWRQYAAAALLVTYVTNITIWMNGTTSQGVLWVMITFVFLTHEQHIRYLDRDKPRRTITQQCKDFYRFVVTLGKEA